MALHVLDEANRCLGCKKPMCQQGCPIHTNIPEVIRLLKDNHLDDAGRMLFENNPLTTVCSLVCNHENQCEGHCIRNRMPSHDPVHFSIIEDYISTTYANKMTSGPAPRNGMKAAVVGSGPAGLTVAVLLARWGYDVTIFDARDKMYSVIAHDLRSPIGTLKMVFNMLSINLTQQQIGEDNMEMITMGNNITESTFMLLDNLLKWTKSQIGRMNTVFQEVDISEVVVFASKMSDLVAQVKNIAVEYDIPGPITVPCDVDMVKTIMRNLMSNAIKYSNEGGRIVISVRETPTHAVISVRDFGTGISEENLPKLLNPEIHHTTYGTKNEEGSGLGLQLVQDLTRRNGGELTIESTLGEGSTFTFTIAKVQPKSETVEDSEGGGIARP